MVSRAPQSLFRAVLAAAVVTAVAACADSGSTYRGARIVTIDRIAFDDGDTFLLDGRPVRILGIDTPETASPDVGIMTDQPWGPAAADTTRALLTRARRIEVAFDGRDTYGRRLAHVFVDGDLLAVALIERALAYENVTHFGDNGFPDLADRILDAVARSPAPPFEPPYQWRRRNQQRAGPSG